MDEQKVGLYLVQLLKSVLEEATPPALPAGVCFEAVYDLGEKHHVANMAFYAIEKLETKPEPVLYKNWQETRDKAILRDILQLTERERLLVALTQHQIKVLPVKGYSLKCLYPQTDMRMMSDLDILVDDAPACKSVMEGLGDISKSYDRGNHDTYYKKPVMNVEIHRSLLAPRSSFYPYYKDVWDQAMVQVGEQGIYTLTLEDAYVYQVVHTYKHYNKGGSGIRSVLDLYLAQKAYAQEMDWQRVEALLVERDIVGFYKDYLKLARGWFDEGITPDEVQDMASYTLTSGVYGTFSQSVVNQIREESHTTTNRTQAKYKYLIKRLFMPLDLMVNLYPILRRYPILLPLF